MHVTYLLSDLGGGTGHHLRSLLARRTTADWSAEIVSEVESTVGAEFPVPLHVLPRPVRASRYPFLQAARCRQLASHFAGNRPDVLHVYFFWSIMYGRVLKAMNRIPVLVENREDLGFNWGRHEYALLALTRAFPDRVVCVCDAVRRLVIQKEGLDPARATVIRNGIAPPPAPSSTPAEARAAVGLDPDRPLVGMVANFDRPVKGVRYFLQAIPRVLEAVPGTQFLLLGGGTSADRIRERARALGVEDALVLPGFDPHVDRWYAAMDVSVLTSLSEGLSLTILESMSRGVPVVATHVGGNPELVVEGKTGFLVPPRDVNAFATAVIRVLREPELGTRLGAGGAERARTEFSLDATVRGYRELYHELSASP